MSGEEDLNFHTYVDGRMRGLNKDDIIRGLRSVYRDIKK